MKTKRASRGSDPTVQRALQILTNGNPAMAQQMLEASIASAPRNAELHYTLGLVKKHLRRHEEALAQFERAISLDGREPRYHNSAAFSLWALQRFHEALEAVERARWMRPGDAEYHTHAARLLERMGRLEDAAKAIDRAIQANPSNPRTLVFRARLALRSGEAAPDRLASLVGDLRPLTTPETAAEIRLLAWDVLADLHEALGEHDRAFEAITQTQQHDRARNRSSDQRAREAYVRTIDAYAKATSAERCAEWTEREPDDGLPSPAMIVGFPRSGTTMLERVLDAHPAVVSLEEQPTFTLAAERAAELVGVGRAGAAFAEKLHLLTDDHVAELRRFYWAEADRRLEGEERGGRLLLDKMPLRISSLAFVNRLFPRSRVIVALRDPRDVCLSCFRQHFANNAAMSFFLDLEDTARLYERVMGHWIDTRERLSLAWREFRYEDTVADLEGQSRSMLAFLGLDWNDAVLAFHERDDSRVVATPSYHAVRQGVSTSAVGRWRRYEAGLAPIAPRLARFIDAFGYAEPGELDGAAADQ